MKVSAKSLVAVFLGLGVETAVTWETKKLQAKLDGGLKKYREGDTVLPGEQQSLFEDIVAEQTGKKKVEVLEDREEFTPPPTEAGTAKPPAEPVVKTKGGGTAKVPGAKPKPAAPAPKEKPTKPAATANGKATHRDKPVAGAWYAGYAKNPLPISDRGPGVLRSIVKHLKKGKLTKDQLLEKVKGDVDRDPVQLLTTINNQVPTRLRLVRGIHVWKDSNKEGEVRYWIEGEGDTPQPKVEKPTPPAKATKPKEPPPVKPKVPVVAKGGGKLPPKPPAATKPTPKKKPVAAKK